MKKFIGCLLVFGILGVSVFISQLRAPGDGISPNNDSSTANSASNRELTLEVKSRNPWTHLRLNNDPDIFRFAIVSDRTGGHREKIFSKAVEQLNYLQPEFVLSVGDLIEGYSAKTDRLEEMWKEFQSFTSKLDMPFFYTPGNHDLSNETQQKFWEEKFGRRYFHFIYKKVLFLILCSEDPPGSGKISKEQQEYFANVLKTNSEVNWTIMTIHKPIWTGDIQKNGWGNIEKMLAGRNYTVFAGHVHHYKKFVRNGMNYYQLATTGGGSKLRGIQFGEFDHISWVTMKKDGPILANLMLDGIFPENLEIPETKESGSITKKNETYKVNGIIYLDGVPPVGAIVNFYDKPSNLKSPRMVADGVVEADGSFTLTTYTRGDGAPLGNYMVTLTDNGPKTIQKTRLKWKIPAEFTNASTTPLTAKVSTERNYFKFEINSSK